MCSGKEVKIKVVKKEKERKEKHMQIISGKWSLENNLRASWNNVRNER